MQKTLFFHSKITLVVYPSAASWRKSSQEIPRISSLNISNQTNGVYENQTEQNYPWYWHNFNQTCNSVPPQSPHCHYHHHSCMQAQSGANDPMLMQQFIQTQQMLINSISQCNQLLWDQQREINNLNSAVLLVNDFAIFLMFLFIFVFNFKGRKIFIFSKQKPSFSYQIFLFQTIV